MSQVSGARCRSPSIGFDCSVGPDRTECEFICIFHSDCFCGPFAAPSLVLGPGELDIGSKYRGPISVVSWNAQGLFSANLQRARRKGAYILKFASECDVILLQEAHVCRGYSCYLDSALAHSHSLFWSDLDNFPVGGIGIVISKIFLGLFSDANFIIIEPGRIACLELKGPLGGLTLWSVHLDHNEAGDKRLERISLLGDATAGNLGSHHLLGGDFNFTMGLEDRLNPADGAFCGGDAREVEAWDRCMGHMVELHQPDLTRKGRQGGSWARLDMIFSSLYGSHLDIRMVGAQSLGGSFVALSATAFLFLPASGRCRGGRLQGDSRLPYPGGWSRTLSGARRLRWKPTGSTFSG